MFSSKMIQKMVLASATFCFLAPLWADDGGQTQPIQLFVAKAQGEVMVVHGGSQHPANPPEPLAENDEIKTGDDGKAYLEFQNGGVVEVDPDSDTSVKQLDTNGDDFKARFTLLLGKLKAKVMKLTTAKSVFEIEAGGVVAGVRGTVFGVDYDRAQNQVNAQTYEGSIFARSGGKEETVDKGFFLTMNKAGIPVRSPLTGRQVGSFKDFVDVSGLLEQKKREMLQDMHNRIMQKLPVPDALKNTIGQHLPF